MTRPTTIGGALLLLACVAPTAVHRGDTAPDTAEPAPAHDVGELEQLEQLDQLEHDLDHLLEAVRRSPTYEAYEPPPGALKRCPDGPGDQCETAL